MTALVEQSEAHPTELFAKYFVDLEFNWILYEVTNKNPSWTDKLFQIASFQKLSLIWYSFYKIIFRNIETIFGMENWLWKANFDDFWSYMRKPLCKWN